MQTRAMKRANLCLFEGSSVLATPSKGFRTTVLIGESCADFRTLLEQGDIDLTLILQSNQLVLRGSEGLSDVA